MRKLFLLLLMTAATGAGAQDLYLFIGTYTNKGSKGIYVYRFNPVTGAATWVSNTDSADNPSYITLSHDGKYLFAANETHGSDPGKVSAYSFDKKNGKLRLINQQESGGDDPCYVAVSHNNDWLTVGNYSGGSLAAFAINKDGSVNPYSQLVQHEGHSVNPQRQEKPHVHCTVFTPDNQYLCTPDLGLDQVSVYKFLPGQVKPLQATMPIKADAGDGPRHLTFAPNGKYAYLMEEMGGKVGVYTYANGKFARIQHIATHPADFKGQPGSADIHLSPDGKFLYASNRGEENNIAIFSVDAGGKLKLKGYQSTMGRTPRNFAIDPTGNFLVVANQDTDNIIIFARNKQTGLLKQAGDQLQVSSPVCLQFLK